MCLPPLEREPAFLPVLYLPGSMSTWKKSDYSLQIGLYKLTEDGDCHQHLRGIGLRFDGPHGASGSNGGMHDFWHVQFMTAAWKRAPIVGCPEWIPKTVPSIPTQARCPVTLLLCVVAGLYGGKTLKSFLTATQVDKRYIDRIGALVPKS